MNPAKWLSAPIPAAGSMVPWPGYVRASWMWKAGQPRGKVIAGYPRAFARLVIAKIKDRLI